MAKRKETLDIEEHLRYMTKKCGIYGCEEITIGFCHNGHGNEIVDFCTMDSHGILKCYEIKVTLSDLKSKAKKSWYGHYNYLAVTEELYYKICDELDKYIPPYVGVIIPSTITPWSNGMTVVKSAHKQNLNTEQGVMLKESMVRSMYYKIGKYRNASDVERMSELQSKYRKAERESKKYYEESKQFSYIISKIERILRRYYDTDIDLEEFVSNVENRKTNLPKKIQLNDLGKKFNKTILKG